MKHRSASTYYLYLEINRWTFKLPWQELYFPFLQTINLDLVYRFSFTNIIPLDRLDSVHEKPRESRDVVGHDQVVLLLLFNIYGVPTTMGEDYTVLSRMMLKFHLMKYFFIGSVTKDSLKETSYLIWIYKNLISFHST